MKASIFKTTNPSLVFSLLLGMWACTSETQKEEIKDEKLLHLDEKKKEQTQTLPLDTLIQDSASLSDKDFATKTLAEETTPQEKPKGNLNKTTESKKEEKKEETPQKPKTKSKYDKIFAYHQGRAVVQLNGKFGYIDKEGYEFVSPKYDFAEDFTGLYQLARVRVRDKVGFVNLEGKEVIPLQYRYVEKFTNGLAHARLIDGETFYIDRTGKHICDILDAHHEGVARFKLGKKIGYVDLDGRVIVPAMYDYGTHFSQGMADVKLNEKHFFINKKNECVKDCPQ